MGPGARSNGASLFGIGADFTVPPIALPERPLLSIEVTPDLDIPDNDTTGVTSVLSVAQEGQLEGLSVAIVIDHTYIGDLRVSLTSPEGRTAVLHNRAGANLHNLVKTYTIADTPALATFVGQQAHGDWMLTVADLAKDDVGTLRRWSLEIGIEEELVPQDDQSLNTDSIAVPALDDFKLIDGIGQAIEKRLHRAGIVTYAQLASLSPTEIASLVGLAGLSADQIAKRDWIAKARERAALSAPSNLPIDTPPLPERQHYATFTVELLLDEDSNVRRTRVRYIQEGAQDVWAGWEDGRLVRFFVEQAALRSQTPPSAALFEGNRLSEGRLADSTRIGVLDQDYPLADLYIDVDDLELDELPTAGQPDSAVITDRMRAQIGFTISGAEAERVTNEQAFYFIHILAYMLATGETIVLVAQQNRLRPGERAYMTMIEFAKPELGHYQILGTIVLSDYNTLGVAVGPKLRVVP